MAVQARRIAPALLVLLVLFASQAAYAAEAFDRPDGHCAGAPPPPEERCQLPLWLPCCDDQAAVGTAASGSHPGSLLVLPLERGVASTCAVRLEPMALRAEIPPDTPYRLSSVRLL